MHCADAACVTACPSGALYHTEFGTVGLNHDRCIGCKNCVAACPFEVPKYEQETDKVYKCDMCESRLRNNLTPACVKACPTGALKWGEKEAMIKLAADRAKELGGDANLYGDRYVGGTHFMYVFQEKQPVYAALVQNPKVPLSLVAWKSLLKPLSLLAAGGIVVGSLLHYLIHGPKRPDDHGETTKKAEGGE
jgi:formate dehydrogenase beta subunit